MIKILEAYPAPRWVAVEVPVSELPPGYFGERLQVLAASPDETVIVVAKHGQIGDWACYVGWPKALKSDEAAKYPAYELEFYQANMTTIEGVLLHGDKLSEGEARAIFDVTMPDFKDRPYRN